LITTPVLEEKTMYEIGRVCYKIAGRDSNNICVILSEVSKGRVLVDGNTRRKMVNIIHLEPTSKLLTLKENASSQVVAKAIADAGLVSIQKGSAKKVPLRAKKQKKTHAQPEPAKKSESVKKSEKAKK
jgi:large subunit ribosomal protein L14e